MENTPSHASAPVSTATQLLLLPSQEWLRRPDEDWTGITDPAVRRRLQNRLNQRSQRARRKVRRNGQNALIPQADKTRNNRKYVAIIPRPDHEQECRNLTQPTSLSQALSMMMRFNAAAYERYYTANPCLDQLLTLSKFNILRAFVDNIGALGLTIQDMEDDALSPFNSTPLHTREIGNLPPSLYPTNSQRSVPHHPWLDCFPFPRIRDNLINVDETFNDCELCTDMMDPTNGEIGVLVWGDPWLPQSWEVTEYFISKWSWVIKGCPEILLSTNYWRARRGLRRLDVRFSLLGSMELQVDRSCGEVSGVIN